jgi:hypothetical protein
MNWAKRQVFKPGASVSLTIRWAAAVLVALLTQLASIFEIGDRAAPDYTLTQPEKKSISHKIAKCLL